MNIGTARERKNLNLVLLVFYMIYATDTVYFYTNANTKIVLLGKASVVAVFLALVFKEISRGKISQKGLLFVISILILLCFGVLVNGELSNGYFMKSVLIVSGMLLSKYVDMKRFSRVYVTVLVLLAIYSLFFYLLDRNFGWASSLISRFAPTVQNSGGLTFYDLILTDIPTDTYAGLRNWGIFWEPGAYQCYLNVAIILLLFVEERRKGKRIALLVLIAAVISTQSTSGFFALALIVLAFLGRGAREKNSETRRIKKLLILCVASVGVLLIMSQSIMVHIFGKLEMGTQSASFAARFVSVLYNIRIFDRDPLVGVGPRHYVVFFHNLVLSNPSILGMQTNTILGMFAVYGVYIAGVFCFLLWKLCVKISGNSLGAVLLFGAFLVMFSTEDFNYSIFINTIVFWGVFYQRENLDRSKLSMPNNIVTGVNAYVYK